jgi:DNA-binding MarR family transcriptional regulator
MVQTKEARAMPELISQPAAVRAAEDGVLELLRTVRKAKARLLADARGEVDSATQLLLHAAAQAGPLRASALAVQVGSDLSTVSRQVAALVTAGLLERRADPADGRACLLAITPAGEAVLADHEQTRAAFFDEVLSGWTQDELTQFAGLLTRFTASYDQVHAARMTERNMRRSRPAATTEGPLA